MQPTAFMLLGLLVSDVAFAAGTRPPGPVGFGSIPYGSSSRDAVQLNHGNGQITHDDGHSVLTYRVSIEGLKFDAKQNYDKNGKAVDAIAVSMSTELPRTCVARFNHVLSLLQARYGQPGSTPLKSRIGETDVKYTVLFQFDRNAGIEAEVTSPDPSSSVVTTGNGSRGHGGVGRCLIRLHYLPPGWVGNL